VSAVERGEAMGLRSVHSVARHMKNRTQFGRISVVVWAVLVTAMPSAFAQAPQIHSQNSAQAIPIVLGFVGGFVKDDDNRHPEVQIIHRLSEQRLPPIHAAAFENRRTAKALEQILQWLDTDGDGRLSAKEKKNARIILFGHSWGGSAVISLAEALAKQDIPVLLTIQVDSINKGWGHDCMIPPNVAQATLFYQSRGILHGCRPIRAEDPNQTQITGMYEVEYAKQPAECNSYPWFDRHFFSTHNAMGCDPHVWSQVEDEIRAQLRIDVPAQEAQVRR
jgi:hypothetical protein